MTLFVRSRDVFDVLHIYLPPPFTTLKLEFRVPEAFFGCIWYTRHVSLVLRHLETKFQWKGQQTGGEGSKGDMKGQEKMGRQGREDGVWEGRVKKEFGQH